MSTETTLRPSGLTERHLALGATFDKWNGMNVPLEYKQNLNDEHKAVRTTAGLFDVSGLKKVFVTGPDALAVCNYTAARDLTKVYPGKSCYTLILNENGKITDDCIMFHLAPDNWMVVHSSGATMEQLTKSAQGKDVKIALDDDLHDISLQGPKAVDFLAPHTPMDLHGLPYFHQMPTRLFGYDCLISRTGYSGERGYEIFAKSADIGPIWDNILEQGKPQGIMACSFTCLDMIRVEANLMFFEFDMTENDTPWDVGLAFTISKKKEADYRGKDAVMASMTEQTTTIYGLVSDCDTAMDPDAEVFVGDKKVGYVTAPLLSAVMNKSIAMFRVDLEYAKPGTEVEVRGENVTCKAVTAATPLYDSKKVKRTT